MTRWRNWSGELRCTPAEYVRARSVDEVVHAVRSAADRGLRVRPTGSGHSFTPLVPTPDVVVDISALDRILHVDRDAGWVRVQAGIRLGALAARLLEYGLAPINLGDIDVQTLAGALSTATHGTGARLSNLSGQVAALALIDGAGQVHHLDDPDDDRLRAARVGLGALGIVTEVTLRVLPAYRLRGHDRVEPRDHVLATFTDRSDEHRHLDVYLFPYSDHALTRTNDVVDAPPDPPRRARRFVEDRLLTTYGLDAVTRVGRRVPSAIPALNRFASRLAGSAPRVDHAHRIFASARDVPFTEMELAVPREHGPAFVAQVLELIERERLPVNFPIEVRTVAGDDALLSPSHERDSVYVAVHNRVGMPVDDYFAGVWELAQRYEPRPHWGKRHPATAAELEPRYPAWSRFQRVRTDFDPDGRFSNDHLDQVLGPITPAGRGRAG